MRGTYHVMGGIAILAITEATLLVAAPHLHDVAITTFAATPAWPALFVLGCLLPDVDSRGSVLGRHVHLPIRHRTWTHSIWPTLPLAALAWLVPQTAPVAMPLMSGILTHLMLDAVSTAGICWIYPWPGFRRYPSGAFIKRSNLHHAAFRWYRTGRRSETVMLVLLCALAVASTVTARLHLPA